MFNFSAEDPVNETGFDLRALCCIRCICNFVEQMVSSVYSNRKAPSARQTEKQDSMSNCILFLR